MLKSELRRKRESVIISSLNKLGVVDVKVIKQLNVAGLGSTGDRNVLRVMNRMVDDGLLESMKKEIKLYCVKGRGFGHWEHRLMLNKFLAMKCLYGKAKIEPRIKIGSDEFRPDFIVPIKDHPKTEKDWCFYEVDRRQKKHVNLEKIERYKRLGLRFEVVCNEDRVYMWKGCVVHTI